MELAFDPGGNHHLVRYVHERAIGVDAMVFERSFLLAARTTAAWAPDTLEQINEAACEAILALDPEVVLLGTGNTQKFAPPALLGYFLSRGIGLEAMANKAAGRTFNLLASEGRRVVAAFLLSSSLAD